MNSISLSIGPFVYTTLLLTEWQLYIHVQRVDNMNYGEWTLFQWGSKVSTSWHGNMHVIVPSCTHLQKNIHVSMYYSS